VAFLFLYYIYILYSMKSDKFYIGYSTDSWKRLIEHNFLSWLSRIGGVSIRESVQ
jgi:hypothetical protein